MVCRTTEPNKNNTPFYDSHEPEMNSYKSVVVLSRKFIPHNTFSRKINIGKPIFYAIPFNDVAVSKSHTLI